MKRPISVHSIHVVDSIWLTCCALHNWLLDIDGMDEEWVAEIYEGDSNDDTAPLPMQRLHHSMREPRTDETNDNNTNTIYVDNGSTQIDQTGLNVVRDLSRRTFQSKLNMHLNIFWCKDE